MLCLSCKQDLTEDAFGRKKSGKLKRMCEQCCKSISRQVKAHKRKRPDRLYSGMDYQSRNLVLRELGFASYKDYLQSDLWKELRVKVYAAKGRTCYLCGSPATELHHNRYHLNDLKGRKIRFISPICRKCHEGIEFKDGKKSTVAEAARNFRKRHKAFRRSGS